MCGIIAGFNTSKSAIISDEIITQYENQYSRGTEGFSVIGWTPQGKIDVKRACEPAKFMFDLHSKKWPMSIVHHRNPTSTDNKIQQTHPIFVSHESLEFDYQVIHNGIISNPNDLRASHEPLDFVYTTLYTEVEYTTQTDKFNDSEAFAIEIVRYIENFIPEVNIRGSFAFIALAINKKTGKAINVHFGRNTRPLKMAAKQNYLFLSSEGKGHDIETEVLYSFKPIGKMKMTSRKLSIKAIPLPPPATNYGTPAQTSMIGFAPKKLPVKKWWNQDEEDDKKVTPEKNGYYLDENLWVTKDYITQLIEECLEALDDTSTVYFAQIEETVNTIRECLYKEQQGLLTKYDEISNDEANSFGKSWKQAEQVSEDAKTVEASTLGKLG